MKNELFALEKAVVTYNDRLYLNEFAMHIYERQALGILCDSINERNTIIEMFRGNCSISGILRFSRKIYSKSARAKFQEYFFVIDKSISLIPSFTVSENIRLFSDNRSFVHSKSNIEETQVLMEKYGVFLDPGKKARDLTAFEQVQTCLLKAAAENRKIVVLANLSEILTKQELFQLRSIFFQNNMTLLFIDSFDSGLYLSAEHTLVVKGRTSIGTFTSSFLTGSAFHRYMTQRSSTITNRLSQDYVTYEDLDCENLQPIFELNNVCTDLLHNLSLSVIPGELLKIYCCDQKSINGFRSLALGSSVITSGEMTLNGQAYKSFRNVQQAMLSGLIWCPESPYKNALIHNMTVRDNLLLEISHKLKHMWGTQKYSKSLDQYINENIGTNLAGVRLKELSPDILQEIAYSKILLFAPSVVILEKPFSDTDLHIKTVTLKMIDRLSQRGIAVILLTMTPSDLYLKDGDILNIRGGQPVNEEDIYQYLYSE